MARERHLARLQLTLLGFAFLALVLWVNWINFRARSLLLSLLCIVAAIALDRRFIPWIDFAKKRENDAIRGAEAEEAVGAILDRLPDNYMVLHDVPGPCGNIDHVVLRKDGAVFVIETKSISGRVTERNGRLLVNGHVPQKNFISQTLSNTFHVRDVLTAELGAEPWVDAAIIFTTACVSVCEIKRIRVMNVCSLNQWMARTPGKVEIARRAAAKWEKLRRVLQTGNLPRR